MTTSDMARVREHHCSYQPLHALFVRMTFHAMQSHERVCDNLPKDHPAATLHPHMSKFGIESEMQKELLCFEETVRQQSTSKSKIKQVDLRLCRLCFKTKFSDGIGRACYDCHRRVCNNCGSYSQNVSDFHKQKSQKGKWRCRLCFKQRELACATGVWFHGSQARPMINNDVFRRKISNAGIESDWGYSPEVEQSDTTPHSSYGPQTDSEAPWHPRIQRTESHRSAKRHMRRRLSINDDQVNVGDEDDLDFDDEQFLLERQKCRQERLQMQRKMTKKRLPRKTSVGTSTLEDGIISTDADCPMHGHSLGAELSQGRVKELNLRGGVRSTGELISTEGSDKVKAEYMTHSDSMLLRGASREYMDTKSPRNRIEEPMARSTTRRHSVARGSKITNPKHLAMAESAKKIRRRYSDIAQSDKRHHYQRVLRADTFDSYSDSAVVQQQPDRIIMQTDPQCSRVINGARRTNSDPMRVRHHSINPSPRTVLLDEEWQALIDSGLVVSGDDPYLSYNTRSRKSSTTLGKVLELACESASSRSACSSTKSKDNSSRGSFHSDSFRHSAMKDSYLMSQKLPYPPIPTVSGSGVELYEQSPIGRLFPDSTGHDDRQDSLQDFQVLDPTKMPRKLSGCNQFHVVLEKDPKDKSYRTNGLGMRVVGGKVGPDGKLGAFVMYVSKGGAADLQGIGEGDQILEWDGSSLQDATFEETVDIMNRSGDTVQLMVMHTRKDSRQEERTRKGILKIKERSPSVVSPVRVVVEREDDISSENSSVKTKRILPKTPVETKKEARGISGKIRLRLWYDPKTCTLAVCVVQAQDLPSRSGPEKEMPYAYTKVFMLPNRSEAKMFRTNVVTNSKNPDWNATHIYDNTGDDEITSKSLEVTVWDSYPNKPDEFLGEVLLDLAQANTQNTSVWYELEQHDENSGPLPCPSPKVQSKSSANGGSVGLLPATPAHDKAKAIIIRRNSPGLLTVPDRALVESGMQFGFDDSSLPKGSRRKRSSVRRRMSDIVFKVGAKFTDRRSKSLDSAAMIPKLMKNSVSTTNTLVPLSRERALGLFSPSSPLVRRSSKTSTDATQVRSAGTSESDLADISFENCPTHLRPTPDGDDITSMLGPGQVPPKPSMEKLVQGDVKLGFMITKGQLEVDVICAKGLSLNAAEQPPDTYVKTYLVGNSKRLQKRKTKTIKANCDPLYRQKIKYSACNVHGRFMQIVIKEKVGGFDRNQCIGEVVVTLDDLDLSSHTMGWYKLFKESATDLGSTESL